MAFFVHLDLATLVLNVIRCKPHCRINKAHRTMADMLC